MQLCTKKKQTLYPLSGKLFCDKHKCGFVRKIRHYKNKEDVVYWYCSKFHKTGTKDCNPACFKEQDLYDILLSVFKTYEIYKEEIANELLAFYIEVSKQGDYLNEKIKLQKELSSHKSKKDKLLDLALDGLLSKEDLRYKKLVIEKQIKQIQANLKELEAKKNNVKDEKQYNKKLHKNILKELEISQNNLKDYIDSLLDKIIVVENESQVNLKIILAGNNIIGYGSAPKLRQISSLKQNKVADFKFQPLCHSHTHS